MAKESSEPEIPYQGLLHCGFCGKSQEEVEVLIQGRYSNICDECVEVCREVIADQRKKK